MRTIVTVQGRGVIAFFLAIFEILIWIDRHRHGGAEGGVAADPGLVLRAGLPAGNLAGIAVECKIALGFRMLRVFTRTGGRVLAERLRAMGQPVTAL